MLYRFLILFSLLIFSSCERTTDISEETRAASLSIKNYSGDIIGTGFVIKGNKIITNYHVVETILDESSSIFVSEFDDETKIKVTLKYKDEHHDIAVLETYAKFDNYLIFNNDKLKSGTEVSACGNGEFGAEGAFTTGTISGEKDIDGVRYLQHSAPITGGNSGGPLVDSKGKLVGINTSTALTWVRDAGGVSGLTRNTTMGFALPANTLKGILESQNLYDDSFTFSEFIDSYIILIIIIFILIISYIVYLIVQKNNIDKGNRKNKVFKPKNLYGKIK
jgi:S1-C subfamily serine protease